MIDVVSKILRARIGDEPNIYRISGNDDAIDIHQIAEHDLIKIAEGIGEVDVVATATGAIRGCLHRNLREMNA